MTTYLILGIILAALTPTITAAVKKYAINNKALSSLMPLVLTAIMWLGDALIAGMNPFSDAAMGGLVVLLAGALSGAKGRDIYKYVLAKAA